MNTTTSRLLFSAVMGVSLIITAGGDSAFAATATVVDTEGFEASAGYTTVFDGDGKLEGQVPATFNGTWLQTLGGTSTAVVQSTVVESGSQAVRVDRAADSDDRWGIPLGGYPGERLICIEWDMRVEATTSTTFGPFFGVEAYDDDGAEIGLLGSLGVDATTGDVLFQAEGSGALTETGTVVTFGDWNEFRIVLDFQEEDYYFFMNDTLLGTTGFVDAGLGQFTDADISTFAAAGDTEALGLTGTAYFDNFVIYDTDDTSKIPEPSTLLLLVLGMLPWLAARKR